MKDDIEIWIYYRADPAETVAQLHADFVANMSRIGPPLGFAGLTPPPTPEYEPGEFCAVYSFRYPIRGLWLHGTYERRGGLHPYRDRASYDDNLFIAFNRKNKAIDYRAILHEHMPKLLVAYRAYRGAATYSFYGVRYCGGSRDTNPIYNRVRDDPALDTDGRNNIFTLEPAMYWDAELCRRALGYGPEEVIRRLEGQVPQVERLMDGVYVVFNDDPDLTYDGFIAMNERYKRILGLTEQERQLMATPLPKGGGT